MRQYPIHGLHHGRFTGSGIPFLYDHLPPFIKLFVDVDLYRADIGAGAAKRRCERQVCIFFHVQIGREDRADRAGYSRMIAMTAAAPVYRAGVKTSGAADTFEGVAEILSAEMKAAAVVDEDDMHLLALTRTPEVTGIGGDRLPRGAAGEQPQEHPQMTALRDQLLDTHTGDVHLRQMRAHVGIPFVSTNDELTRLGDGEIHAGERGTTREEFFAEMQPGGMGEELRVGIAFGSAQVLVEYLADLLLFLWIQGKTM